MKERYVGLVGEPAKLSVGKAEEKGGDVASLVPNGSPCQGNIHQHCYPPFPKRRKEMITRV